VTDRGETRADKSRRLTFPRATTGRHRTRYVFHENRAGGWGRLSSAIFAIVIFRRRPCNVFRARNVHRRYRRAPLTGENVIESAFWNSNVTDGNSRCLPVANQKSTNTVFGTRGRCLSRRSVNFGWPLGKSGPGLERKGRG